MQSLNNTIANTMEGLSSLGIQLSDDALEGAVDRLCEALLQGGKIVLVTDDDSIHCDSVLINLMGTGDPIERPALPLISLRLTGQAQAASLDDPLSLLLKPTDQLLVIAKEADNLAPAIRKLSSVCICESNSGDATDSEVLLLPTIDRLQWQMHTTLICNYFVKSIESRLFGF